MGDGFVDFGGYLVEVFWECFYFEFDFHEADYGAETYRELFDVGVDGNEEFHLFVYFVGSV